MKKFIAIIVAILSVGLVFHSCLPPEIDVDSVTLNKTTVTMHVGDIETLTAIVLPSNATNPTVTWTSSDPNVATVQEGFVIAKAEGSAVITATADRVSASCIVSVVPISGQVTSITLDKEAIELEVGGTESLTATIEPASASGLHVEWTSSNPGVAQVTAEGTVVAIAVGTSAITASVEGQFASCPVTVVEHTEPGPGPGPEPEEPVAVTEVTLAPATLSLVEGGTATLTATVLPEDATDKSVTWTSDDETVATVDAEGNVTAVAVGTATITVTTTDGSFTATCAVTVAAEVFPVTSITVTPESHTMMEGEVFTLTATVLPENATDPTVTWTSSDDTKATVSETGVVTAVAAGTATITASSGDQSATCELTITPLYIPVDSVTLSPSAVILNPGTSMYLTATVYPENATNQEITWDSDNIAVVRAYPGGQIFTSALGTATVTVTTEDGGHTATCVVKVEEAAVHVTGVILSPNRLDLHIGETGTLQPVFSTDDPNHPTPTNQQVTWTSNNEAIATVDAAGVVTAVSEGNTYITVTTDDGGFTALSTVYVTPVPVTSVTITPPVISILVDEVYNLTATVLPENTSYTTIEWESLNAAIAGVDQDGNVKGRRGGTTMVKATCGGVSGLCEVRVVVPLTGIAFLETEIPMEVGDTKNLSSNLKFTPTDATNKSVTWSSNNEAVATVNASGQVTAVQTGVATITARAYDGGYTAECKIIVGDPSTASGRP